MAAAAVRSPRNVDHYRDTSLDGLIGAESSLVRSPPQRRGGNSSRRSVSDTDSMPMTIPQVPEAPREPPASYRQAPRDMNMPQRSFSQRAKARPYLREAFNDDDMDGGSYAEPSAYSQVTDNDHPGRGSQPQPRGEQAPLQVNTSMPNGRPLRSAQAPATGPMESAASGRRPQSYQQQNRQVSEPGRHLDEPMSAASRSTAARDISTMPSDEQRRDWAPDRSPLQKLEVTLNDISKEEKRARMEEAEMLLRESKAGRGGRSGNRDITPVSRTATTAAKQPAARNASKEGPASGLEDAGLVRNLSTTQRDRLNHSTTIDSHKPDVNRLSGDGRRGFEYEEQVHEPIRRTRQSTGSNQNPHQASSSSYGYDDTLPQRRVSSGRTRALDRPNQSYVAPQSPAVSRQPPPERQYSGEYSQQPPNQDVSSRFPQHNPVWQSNSQTAAHTVPSNITRAVSMQQKKPPVNFPDDRGLERTESLTKDTNTSHKAALAAGAAAESMIGRSGSKKLQKAPPPGYQNTRTDPDGRRYSFDPGPERPLERPQQSGAANFAQGVPGPQIAPYQNEASTAAATRTGDPVGLGLRNAPASRDSSDQPLPPKSNGQRPRQPSVSFKEPFDRARPVDEWKNAGVARLTLDDFALENAAMTDNNKAWWEANSPPAHRRSNRRSSQARKPAEMSENAGLDSKPAAFSPPLLLKCGPLLRYTGMKRTRADQSTPSSGSDQVIWRGSVMIVTADSQSSYEKVPTLRLYSQPKRLLSPPPQLQEGEELAPEFIDPIAGLTKMSRIGTALYVRPVDHLEESKDLSRIEDDNGLFESSPSPLDIEGSRDATAAVTNNRLSEKDGQSFGRYQEVAGIRLYADPVRGFTFWRFNLEIELGQEQSHVAYRINHGMPTGFWVPGREQSMNLMFHSCNGFSLSVDPDRFSGPDPLWRDVLNSHQTTPFHAMIGGGDQVYNDRVAVQTQLFSEWTRTRNPEHKHHAPFTNEMKEELESFYLDRYAMWFSQGLFGMANSQIPMINIWDDHDIIDGFGSYPDHFMSSPVFAGLGNVAFKYYMLFQHQSVPEETTADEPSWVLGVKPGPFIPQLSRSLFLSLGKHVAFLGIDCRTERRRDEILTEATTDNLLERCRRELIEGETRHLIVLLGVPIAYPRLVWLENLLTSKAMDPVKALGRAGVFKGGFLNKFDGGVEILDDLDDHWTAKNHKHERNLLIEDLQDLAAEKSVRITILGGDVHLAAVGQFYSNPKLRIPKDRDHRYMPNVISSAIVNTPPSDMVADVLNKRNKVHHLNKYTDEQMVPLFTHDPQDKRRNNKHLLPKRNWCSIREYLPGFTPPPTPPESLSASDSEEEAERPPQRPQRRFSFSREDVNPRNLIRRISQRAAPPSAYRQTSQNQNASQDSDIVDPDCPVHGESGGHSQPALPTQQRQSLDSGRPPSQRPASFEQSSSRGPQRPGFFRRPTNLSEKAARKGNVMAVNPDGTEFDVNDHVNLEGGLDITLNCEIHQGDVAGFTAPYRLLVPALWYDGSSDREKIDDADGVHRKPTLLKRFSGTPKKDSKQSQENSRDWDEHMSDDGSHSGSEDQEEQPRRGFFGLFGGRRGRQRHDEYDDEYQQGHMDGRTHQGQPPQYRGQKDDDRMHDGRSQSGYHQNRRGGDRLYDSQDHPTASGQLQSSATTRQPYVIGSQPRSQPQSQSQLRAQSQPYRQSDPRSPAFSSQSEQPHGGNSKQQRQPQTQPRSAYAEQAYQQQQQQQSRETPQSQTRMSRQAQPLGIESDDQYQEDLPESQPQPRLSKQARLLGLSSDEQYKAPGQAPLRGHGIIGRGQQDMEQQSSPRSQNQEYDQRGSQEYDDKRNSRGYSGVSAYRPPKPERRWSLRKVRDRARSGTRWDYQD